MYYALKEKGRPPTAARVTKLERTMNVEKLDGGLSALTDVLCSVCGRPPHPCDDPECVQANKPIAEMNRFLITENARLRKDVNTLNNLLRDKGHGQGEIDYMAWQEEEIDRLRALLGMSVGA